MINPTLADQVREALATFQSAHEAAEVAAAAYAHQKRLIGSNEAERKERKAETSADEYSGYVDHLPIVEHNYKAAAAHLERVEKNLNVLRELNTREVKDIEKAIAELNCKTAEVNRAWAEIADRTAIKYSELQMQPPARIILNTYPAEPDF
jgi:pyruvate formate-lyase activating enzyme-like uncharacterized protein